MSPGITGWMRLLCASALVVAGCTGRLPGTGATARSRPGVVYETVRVPPPRPEPEPAPAPAPAIAPPDAEYAAPPTGQSAYAEVPSYPSEPAAVAAPAPPVPAPVPAAMASAGAGTRDQQLAILTEAVSALRAEISRSYTYSQELVEETKKLRSQLRTMRLDLEKTRGENEKLRAQVRTLERQLKEIHVSPPVQGQAAPPPDAAAPAAPPAPAAPAPPPADAIPEPPVVDDRGVPADQDPELLEEEENTPPSP